MPKKKMVREQSVEESSNDGDLYDPSNLTSVGKLLTANGTTEQKSDMDVPKSSFEPAQTCVAAVEASNGPELMPWEEEEFQPVLSTTTTLSPSSNIRTILWGNHSKWTLYSHNTISSGSSASFYTDSTSEKSHFNMANKEEGANQQLFHAAQNAFVAQRSNKRLVKNVCRGTFFLRIGPKKQSSFFTPGADGNIFQYDSTGKKSTLISNNAHGISKIGPPDRKLQPFYNQISGSRQGIAAFTQCYDTSAHSDPKNQRSYVFAAEDGARGMLIDSRK